VLLVAPVIIAGPTFHWYAGAVPPLVIAAVKVTLVPAQIVEPGDTVMLMVGATFGFTVSKAALVVLDPQMLVTTQRNWFKFIGGVIPAITRVAVVVPE
jgi:hypothetical protein